MVQYTGRSRSGSTGGTEEVYGLTFTLLTTKEGKKMGKTENGALWLDPPKDNAV